MRAWQAMAAVLVATTLIGGCAKDAYSRLEHSVDGIPVNLYQHAWRGYEVELEPLLTVRCDTLAECDAKVREHRLMLRLGGQSMAPPAATPRRPAAAAPVLTGH